jgi:hypothetical protein
MKGVERARTNRGKGRERENHLEQKCFVSDRTRLLQVK